MACRIYNKRPGPRNFEWQEQNVLLVGFKSWGRIVSWVGSFQIHVGLVGLSAAHVYVKPTISCNAPRDKSVMTRDLRCKTACGREQSSTVGTTIEIPWFGNFDCATQIVLAKIPTCFRVPRRLFQSQVARKPSLCSYVLQDIPGMERKWEKKHPRRLW